MLYPIDQLNLIFVSLVHWNILIKLIDNIIEVRTIKTIINTKTCMLDLTITIFYINAIHKENNFYKKYTFLKKYFINLFSEMY